MANQVGGGMKSLNVHMDVAGADSGIIVEEYARTQKLRMIELSHDPVIPAVEKTPTASLGDAPLVGFDHRLEGYR